MSADPTAEPTSSTTAKPTPINALAQARQQARELQAANDALLGLAQTYLELVANAEGITIHDGKLTIDISGGMPLRTISAFGNAIRAANGGHPIFAPYRTVDLAGGE